MTMWRVRRKLSGLLRGRFVGTTGWSTAAVAVSAVTGILTARGLGPESRGTLALVLSIAGLCVLVGAMGSNVAIRRHLPRKEGVSLRGYERLSIALIVPLVVVLLAALYTAAALIDPAFGRWEVGLTFVAYGVGYYLSNQALDLLNALGLVVQSARTNALGSLFCLALVAGSTLLGWGLTAIILSYTLSTVFQFFLAYAMVIRRGHRLDPSIQGMRTLLRYGIRLLGLNLGQSLTFRADTVILGALATPQAVGMYAVATSPAVILRISTNALGQLAFHQAASGESTIRTICMSLLKLLAVLVPMATVGWVTADWLLVFVYGHEYEEAAQAFRVLLLAEIALAPFLVLGRTIAGLGSTWGAGASGLAGVAAMLISGFLLIPVLGAVGAAWSSVIAYATMSAVAGMILVLIHRRSISDMRGDS